MQEVEKVESAHGYFKSFIKIEVGNWVRLFECPTCKQLWAITEWDKYQTQLATKIDQQNRQNWQTHNIEAEKVFLIRNRGGLGSEICAWANCNKVCVVGSAYCVEHLYATGVRE